MVFFSIELIQRDIMEYVRIEIYLIINCWINDAGDFDMASHFTSSGTFLLATRFGYLVHVIRIAGNGQADGNRWILGCVFATRPIRWASSSATSETRLKCIHGVRLRDLVVLAVFILKKVVHGVTSCDEKKKNTEGVNEQLIQDDE